MIYIKSEENENVLKLIVLEKVALIVGLDKIKEDVSCTQILTKGSKGEWLSSLKRRR
jgi:hypothetical protein